jgi:putative ABC transport system permease protein
MTWMLCKLAFGGIRSRRLASALTIVIAGAAAATIVVALEVRSSGVDPWERTFDAANGAHVLAFAPSRADARALSTLPGVDEHAEPIPLATATVVAHGSSEVVELAGLSGRSAVNAPVRTEGSGLRAGGIVLERSFAEAIGVGVGADVEVATTRGTLELQVLGRAVLPSQPRFPRRNPGLAWVTRATLERVVPDRGRWRWSEALRLSNPTDSIAFTERAAASLPERAQRSGNFSFATWQDQRDDALRDAQPMQVILTMFTILLLVVAFVVVGILVGARASAQYREIGLLKAAGLTPRQIGAVGALESGALGLVATVLGFALGATLAPRLAAASAETLLGSPTIAANPWHMLVASCFVLPVLLASAWTSTRRSIRFTVLQSIHAGTAAPAKSRIAHVLSHSRVTLTTGLGLKDLLARGRRAVLLASAITLTGAVVVVALSLQATLDARPAGEVSDVPDELPLLVYTLDTVLLVITATTLVAVALLSVRERIRDYGVLKAIGLTPRQIRSTIVSAHAVLGVVASVLSLPLGVGLYLALYGITNDTTEDAVLAPWWAIALIPIGTVLLVVAATSIPARLATRLSTADALRYE